MNLNLLKDELYRDEGLMLFPYKCSAGHWTIGYGRNLKAYGFSPHEIEQLKQTGITEEQAEKWLDEDVDKAIFNAEWYFKDLRELSDARQRVLCNMAFNLGLAGLMTFKGLRAALSNSDYDRAADEMVDSLWYRQVGDRAKRLVQMMREG